MAKIEFSDFLTEFDIAKNTMHLIYGQTLAWIAIYYSPLSSLMFIIILIFMFFINLVSKFDNVLVMISIIYYLKI